MDLVIRVPEEIADVLFDIAKLKDCSINTAAKIVLEKYAVRTKRQIESAYRIADNSFKP